MGHRVPTGVRAGPRPRRTAVRRILALGGHDFTSRPPDRAVCELLLRLAGERGGERPRICILPTASGDTSEQIGRFYAAFGERSCEPSDVSLFRLGRRPMALRDHLLSQDLIYVGGGSLVNLLAVWEAHDIASILSLAWRQGIVLAGQSAGAMCWFEAGITKSSGKPLAAAGLGLLSGSLCVHYNNEPERRAAYLEAVGEGMPERLRPRRLRRPALGGRGTPLGGDRPPRRPRLPRQPAAQAASPSRRLPARFLPAPAPAALREDIAEFRRIKTMRKTSRLARLKSQSFLNPASEHLLLCASCCNFSSTVCHHGGTEDGAADGQLERRPARRTEPAHGGRLHEGR